jgi:hypothetical protein
MILIVKVVILVGLIKLLLATEKPVLCAGIYGAGVALLMLGFGIPFGFVYLRAGGAFILAWLYFAGLNATEGTKLFWVILIGGLLIGLV